MRVGLLTNGQWYAQKVVGNVGRPTITVDSSKISFTDWGDQPGIS